MVLEGLLRHGDALFLLPDVSAVFLVGEVEGLDSLHVSSELHLNASATVNVGQLNGILDLGVLVKRLLYFLEVDLLSLGVFGVLVCGGRVIQGNLLNTKVCREVLVIAGMDGHPIISSVRETLVSDGPVNLSPVSGSLEIVCLDVNLRANFLKGGLDKRVLGVESTDNAANVSDIECV